MAFPPAFNDVWDITQPPDTQLANQGAVDFRALKLDTMQRLSLLSGTLANRPTPETVNATWGGVGFGLLYFSTDTGQIFQWVGIAWNDVSSNFLSPNVVFSLSLIGETLAIPSTFLYSAPKAGIYRIASSLVVTTPGTGGNIQYAISWDNGSGSASSPAFSGLIAASLAGAEGSLPTNSNGGPTGGMYVAAGGLLSYIVGFSAVTGPVQFRFNVRVEYLG
jgi:hypothetical protein